jgi:hypothetical protein
MGVLERRPALGWVDGEEAAVLEGRSQSFRYQEAE